MADGKWIYEHYGREIWNTCSDEFDTMEQAIEAGISYFTAEYGSEIEIFQVGQKELVSVPCVDAEWITENVSERMYDDVGVVAEDWLYHIDERDMKKLEDRINEVFISWLQ